MGIDEQTSFLGPVPFQHTPNVLSRVVPPEKAHENGLRAQSEPRLHTILETMHFTDLERHLLSY